MPSMPPISMNAPNGLKPTTLPCTTRPGTSLPRSSAARQRVLFFEQRAARQHEIARLVARDPEREALADERREILDEPRIDLRRRHEATHAGDVDGESALDDLGDEALDGNPEVGGLLQLGALLRGRDRPS